MICAAVDPNGLVYVLDPQPVDITTCGLVIQSSIEAASSPFSMTPEQGAQIAGAILMIWAIAFTFRMLIRALNVDTTEEKST